MNSILKVNPKVTRLINYIKDIEDGKLQIPSFQRDFVWGKKEKLDLFDSLKLGYPIGSLLFWKPIDTFRVKEEIGPYRVPRPNGNVQFFYILDGFQRLSTLFGCLVNPLTTQLERNETELARDFSIFYDLEAEEFTLSRSAQADITFIPVNTLIDTYSFLDYVERLRLQLNDNARATRLIDRARTLSSSILDYQLPSIEINGGSIEDAVDIFSRINSKGAKISTDWMVSALTYNEEREFRLGTEIDDLITNLANYNFEKIKRELILQCIQNSFGKVYFDEKIADMVKRPNFIEVSQNTIRSIEKAVKFLFEELLVIDYKLLPYGTQLVFITYFFNEVENPSLHQLDQLKKWFWTTTYSGYFTLYSLSKQRMAFFQFKSFVIGMQDDPIYNDKPNIPFAVTDFPKSINFGSVRAKALVLFLLNYGNGFSPVNANEVDELKIYYLFRDYQVPEAVIPIIIYTPEHANRNIIQGKPQDLSFLFSSDLYTLHGSRLLLSLEMLALFPHDGAEQTLLTRKLFIQRKEREFVNALGLEYEQNSTGL